MSDQNFTPLHKLLKSGSSTAEIVDRIEGGDLYWRDDFDRHVLAGDVEKECVLESLRVHVKMLNDPIEHEGVQVTEYWNQWASGDAPFMARHALVRGGFLDVSKEEAVKPSITTDRDHMSDRLAILNQAALRFWGNPKRNDRSTHTLNSTVVAWLMDRGYSKVLAEKAATIIRPEWAPTGRKPEK